MVVIIMLLKHWVAGVIYAAYTGGSSPEHQILFITERRCFDDLLTGLATAQSVQWKTLEIGLNDQTINEEDRDWLTDCLLPTLDANDDMNSYLDSDDGQ